MASPLASSPAQGNGVNHHHKVSGNPTTTVVQPADSELEEERTSEEEEEEEEGDDNDEDANNLEETGNHQQTLAGLQSGLKPNLDESAQKAKDVDHGEEEEGGDDREDEDEDEDDHEDDDDDEEEDEEPSLKYGRLEGDVSVILEKDSASSLAVSGNLMALGTHNGMVHILDLSGKKLKSYRPHSASINDIRIDSHNEFVATAAMDGQVIIHSITGSEVYGFDFKRPLKALALDPEFARRGTRPFVCGGMAGTLVMQEKGWLGNKETVLHSNEGPIWAIEWRKSLIAWANDMGVKLYDTTSQQRISHTDRPPNSPRADLFKCILRWQDDSTLIIAWADQIKVARIRTRTTTKTGSAPPGSLPYIVEITAHFQVDCMISGIVPHHNPIGSFLVLAYISPDTFDNEATLDPAEQRRKAANRPELCVISRAGIEVSSDELNFTGYHLYGCSDYGLQPALVEGSEPFSIVVSPKQIIFAKPRDAVDHIEWLVERKRYQEALDEVEKIKELKGLDVAEIGRKYIEHLVDEGEFEKAAQLSPKVFGENSKDWEKCVFIFVKKQQLQAIIPHIPTKNPQLDRLVYEIILVHFLNHDRDALLTTIKKWPPDIYDVSAVVVAIKAQLDRSPNTPILMECLAELYMLNRQPGKALEYFLRLRRPNVFDLIRDHNLFTVVKDQALLLVEFDQELEKKRKSEAGGETAERSGADEKGKGKKETSKAIALLVDHTYSIPIARVVQQLQVRPYYLYLYLDALFDKDPQLAADFADIQLQLYAEYAPPRLIDFLRASNNYSLEKAYQICKARDLVLEMVFLLGRMGDNKKALTLIIERLGDVNRAIDFAKEQNDDDLWEDLLRYSETRPPFIRGLLENVGAEIDPIRLIRRIKNGLEIPGLKDALIKILWDFNLQISLLEGCQTILHSDCTTLATGLQARQTNGTRTNAAVPCPICSQPLFSAGALPLPASTNQQPLALMFLCRHIVHVTCVKGGNTLPRRPIDDALVGFLGGIGNGRLDNSAILSGKIAYSAVVRSRLEESCPVCHLSEDGPGAHRR